MRDYFMYEDSDVSVDDVIKFLFEAKKDKHASRIIRLVEQLKLMQGREEIMIENRSIWSAPQERKED